MRGQIRFFCWFFFDSKTSPSVFLLGKLLTGQVDLDNQTILGSSFNFSACYVAANEAIDFQRKQIKACRRAVDAWTIVGIRLKVVRDIRKVIGMILWNCRHEATYSIKEDKKEQQSNSRRLRAEKRIGKTTKN